MVKVQVSGRPNFDYRSDGSDWVTPDGRRVPKTKLIDLGNGRFELDSVDAGVVFPSGRINTLTNLALSNPGVQLKAIEFDTNRMFVDADGKVYTRNSKGDPELVPDQKGYDPESNSIIIDAASEAKVKSQVDAGMTDPGKVISQKEAPDALKPKDANESFAQWEARISKYGSYVLYTGVAILGITTIASFIEWLKGNASAVNAEVFKIKEIKREGKISYTSQYQVCAGDRVYEFKGFENVNKAAMNDYPGYVTTGGAGNLDDSSQTFTALDAGVSYKPPDGKELTFRVETNELRRLSCTLANISRDVASGAANIGAQTTKGFFEGLGIDPAWLIGGIILLIVLAIVGSVVFK